MRPFYRKVALERAANTPPMKRLRQLVLGFAVLAVAAAPAAPITVPQAQIDAENARWAGLGVKVPPGGIVLPHPYASPYSNRSFVVPYSWFSRKNDVPVSAAALRRDLPILRFLIEKTYAGYEPASSHGWSWNKMFRDWDAQLARSGKKTLPLKTAFAPWERLQEAQRDNHSGVLGDDEYESGSASAVLAQRPQHACTELQFSGGRTVKLAQHDAAQQPHAVQAWDGARLVPAWYTSYPRRYGTARTVLCGSPIALTRVAPGTPLSQTPEYRVLDQGIAYIRLSAFTDAADDALRNALAKAPQLGRERLVIFDLRGNRGGNAPSDVLTNWFAESAIEQAGTLAQSSTLSCFSVALSFNFQQQAVASLKAPVPAGLEQALQQLVDALKGSATPDCSVQPQNRTSDRSLRDHRFTLQPEESGQTRIIALVDSGCSNECEYVTYVLAGLPNTVIAGESTFGIMGFAQPGDFVLPYSGVPFRLSIGRTDPYGDGRSVDGYGITVDVLLSTGHSSSLQSLGNLARLLAG
jgi:hypothetical protein